MWGALTTISAKSLRPLQYQGLLGVLSEIQLCPPPLPCNQLRWWTPRYRTTEEDIAVGTTTIASSYNTIQYNTDVLRLISRTVDALRALFIFAVRTHCHRPVAVRTIIIKSKQPPRGAVAAWTRVAGKRGVMGIERVRSLCMRHGEG